MSTVRVALGTGGTVRVTPGGVVDGASFQAGALSPCGWVTIFGENLADATMFAPAAPLPFSLQGAQVFLAGQPMPLQYVSSGQINAQAPCGIQPNSEVGLQILHGSQHSLPVNVVVATAQPEIFTVSQGGSGQAAAFWTNGQGAHVVADSANPVSAGDVIEIYALGLGAVTPAVPEGSLAPLDVLSKTVLPATVTIAGKSAEVVYSGLTPGSIGIYQVNAKIPGGFTSSGVTPLYILWMGTPARAASLLQQDSSRMIPLPEASTSFCAYASKREH
jgi:uncharacterized protein (TIGR03437 family)